MTEKKKPGACVCKLSETMFKLRAATARVERIADDAKKEARQAMDELMAENPGLRYIEAAEVFQALNKVSGVHADYMAAHKACLPILDQCDTEPPANAERR
jgi:hypothetical protein